MKKKKVFVGVTIAILAIILVLGLVFVYKHYMKKPVEKEPYINFVYDLVEGEELTITKLEPEPIEDIEIIAYDFSLSSGQPDGAIEIVIPYNTQGVKKGEEHLSVCARYYNEETKEWERCFYFVNPEKETVHIFTDHLSTFGAFTVSNKGKRNEYISGFDAYASYLSLPKAEEILISYANQKDSWQMDMISSFVDAGADFAFSSAETFLSLGGSYDDIISKPFQNLMTGISIGTACSQIVYNSYDKGVRSSEATYSAFAGALSIASNFAVSPIQIGYMGVSMIELSISEVRTFAIANKYKSTNNMYQAYYNRAENKRTTEDWKKLFEKIYKENKGDPKSAVDLMAKAIDDYVEAYWEVASYDWESWIDSYDENGSLAKYPWPAKKDRENISAVHKKKIYEQLNSVFRKMTLNMYLDSLIEREENYKKLVNYFNSKYAITIKENIKDGKEPTWGGYYIKFAPLSKDADLNSWAGKMGANGQGRVAFTMLAHLKAGFPMQIEIYKTAEDLRAGENKIKTISLESFDSNEQLVLLEPRDLEEPETEPETQPETTPGPEPVNPWYDITIESSDSSNPDAFRGWYAIVAYPKNQEVRIGTMYREFDNNGKCLLSIQESDYIGLGRPSKIWIYSNVADLLAGNKADVEVSFSLSGSYAGEYQSNPLYKLTVKAKPPKEENDPILETTGYYQLWWIRSELYKPKNNYNPVEINQSRDYEMYEMESAEVWIHYNGPSMTYKSKADPQGRNINHEKITDYYYVYEHTDESGNYIKMTIDIMALGSRIKITRLSQKTNGEREYDEYIGERVYPEVKW